MGEPCIPVIPGLSSSRLWVASAPLLPFPFAFLFQRPGGRLQGKKGEEVVGKEVRTALDFLVPRLGFTEGTLTIPVTVSDRCSPGAYGTYIGWRSWAMS